MIESFWNHSSYVVRAHVVYGHVWFLVIRAVGCKIFLIRRNYTVFHARLTSSFWLPIVKETFWPDLRRPKKVFYYQNVGQGSVWYCAWLRRLGLEGKLGRCGVANSLSFFFVLYRACQVDKVLLVKMGSLMRRFKVFPETLATSMELLWVCIFHGFSDVRLIA